MDDGGEEAQIAYEGMTALVRMRSSLIDLLLRPAGIPADLYEPVFVLSAEPRTSSLPSRRQTAETVITAILKHPQRRALLTSLVKAIAAWEEFGLAEDPRAAQNVIRRAHRWFEHLSLSESIQALRAELGDKREIVAAAPSETALRAISQDSRLLLAMFKDLMTRHDPARQAWLLQELLNRLFLQQGVTVLRSFRKRDDGDEIEGTFQLGPNTFLCECHYTAPLAVSAQVEPFTRRVDQSRAAAGLLLALAGWSENLLPSVKQSTRLFLADQLDLRSVLDESVDLRALLVAKSERMAAGQPYYSAAMILS